MRYELSRTKLDHYSDPDCISLLVGWGWVGGVGWGGVGWRKVKRPFFFLQRLFFIILQNKKN